MRLEEVQQAAVNLFSDKGYAATGIRELGRELGLNSATLYHYAGGKEELLVSIMRTCLEELLRAATEAADASTEPRIQIARLIRAHVGVSAFNPKTARVTDHEIRALSPENYKSLIAIRDEYESIFARVIEQGSADGQFKLTDLRLARLAILEMCNGVANWYQPVGRLTVSDVQNRFVEFGCRIVGVEPVTVQDLGAIQKPVRLPSEPDAA